MEQREKEAARLNVREEGSEGATGQSLRGWMNYSSREEIMAWEGRSTEREREAESEGELKGVALAW